MHLTLRIYSVNSLRHDFHFTSSYGIFFRYNLPIYIAFRNKIIIHNINPANAGSGQSFHNIAANSPDSKDNNLGGFQLLHSGLP